MVKDWTGAKRGRRSNHSQRMKLLNETDDWLEKEKEKEKEKNDIAHSEGTT